ncbi:MOSC domain-containing protein [Rhodocytophaga rosea]|uniref:MOSC domain-containing protein n=1 Tax=Rhodocytophaga rosea TaxID=2704465 RepID=A0A6C0GUI3_9BACT|nr:MOSC domain-containing protein [Rhodocytophaga rosea]
MVLSEINIYPIKSLGGISLSSARIEERGLQFDRRWMLVDAQKQFMTQRKIHKMALIKASLHDSHLQVDMMGKSALHIPFLPQTDETATVTIWDDTCQGVIVSQEANEWFSDALQMPCKLVYMPDNSIREVDHRYAKNNEIVSFADAYPFLLIGQASLDDLNQRLPEAVPMNRFRPNLVVTTDIPFAEDRWKSIRVGDTIFHLAKPCARCVLTTIDQQTGNAGKEPLKTLSGYRTINNKVLFGQNLLWGRQGNQIQLGDKVEILAQ